MRLLVLVLIAVGIALGLGGWSVQYALARFEGTQALVIGAWHSDRTAGSPTADPYSKARQARSGDLVLGLGEGVAFQARVDTGGRELRRECSYRLEGIYPPARVATLAAYDPEGRLVPVAEGRPGHLVSSNWMRRDDNSALVQVGALPQPGNWLALSGEGPFVLALTFYDTPVSTDSGAAPIPMPYIVRTGCLVDG